MLNSEKSLQLFNDAIDLKRQGYFDDALRLYVKSMQVYPEDPNGMESFYAMGKVFYLKGNAATAVKCYTVYNRLCALKTPLILQDYQNMLRNDKNAEQNIIKVFCNLALHWGWSSAKAQLSKDFYSINSENEQLYRNSLLGKNDTRFVSVNQQIIYNQYQDSCKNIGYQLIFSDFQYMIDTPTSAEAEVEKYIDQIFNIVKTLPNTNTSSSNAAVNDAVENHSNRAGKCNLENLPYDSLGFSSEGEMDDFFEDINE